MFSAVPAGAHAAALTDCERPASRACYFGFEPAPSGGRLNFYASQPPGHTAPLHALIAMHGHPRDADKTFDAALLAVKRGGALGETVVIAPVFQVAADRAAKCRTAGVLEAAPGDLLWTCASWLEGGAAIDGGRLTSFAALDALVQELARQWPSLRTITIAGFSAGAQMVQHAIGFAAAPPAGVSLRYVVADPGTWLYFDAVRPQALGASKASSCPGLNRWKYGTEGLPETLGRDAAAARATYRQADITYVEGALDTGTAKGTAHRVLDKSCAAMAQGPYRRERGLAYARYDSEVLLPPRPRPIVIVPGCAHDVACVFPSAQVRPLLLGTKPGAR